MSHHSPDFVDSCRVLFDYLQRNKHAVASMLIQYSKQFISKRKEFKGYKINPKVDRADGRLYLEIQTPSGDFGVYSQMLDGVIILSDIPKNPDLQLKPCILGLMERMHTGIRLQVIQVLKGRAQIPFIVFGPQIDSAYDRRLVKLIMSYAFKNIFKETLSN